MPELINPLFAPRPPSPWRHSGFGTYHSSTVVPLSLGWGFRVPWLPPPTQVLWIQGSCQIRSQDLSMLFWDQRGH